jgi:hypothetical protein
MIGPEYNSEQPTGIRLVFVRNNIRFPRFSTTSNIPYLWFSRWCDWGGGGGGASNYAFYALHKHFMLCFCKGHM